MKTKILFLLFVTMMLLVFPVSSQTEVSINTGILVDRNFISTDKIKQDLKNSKISTPFIGSFWRDFYFFHKRTQLLGINIPFGFLIKADGNIHFISIDTLFILSNKSIYWSFRKKNLNKIKILLIESVIKDSMVFFYQKRKWKQLGFLWGQDIVSKEYVIYKSPYLIREITKEDPRVDIGSIFRWIFFILLFSLGLFKLSKIIVEVEES